jgi:hypothetical protein
VKFSSITPFLYLIMFILASNNSKCQHFFCFNGSDYEIYSDIKNTVDGGFALVGGKKDSTGQTVSLFLQTDASGAITKRKTYKHLGYGQYTNSIAEWIRKGFVLGGYNYYNGKEFADFIIIDSTGTIFYDFSYGGPDDQEILAVEQAPDSGYIAVGYTYAYGAGMSDLYIVKVGKLGNTEWINTVGGYYSDGNAPGTSVTSMPDGGFVVVGNTMSFGGQSSDIYMVKLNSDGSLAWTRTFGGPQFDEPSAVVQTSDGGIAVGGKFTPPNNHQDYFISKFSAAGTLLWSKSVDAGGTDILNDMVQTSDKGFIMVGYSDVVAPNSNDGLVVKLDSVGNMEWSSLVGDDVYHEQLKSVVQDKDKNYAMVGNQKHPIFQLIPNCGYFVKIDSTGNGCCVKAHPQCSITPGGTLHPTGGSTSTGGLTYLFATTIAQGGTLLPICAYVNTQEHLMDAETIVFPNPINSSSLLKTQHHLNKATLILENSCGQLIYEVHGLSGYEILLPYNNLPEGIYLLRLIEDNKLIAQKKVLVAN